MSGLFKKKKVLLISNLWKVELFWHSFSSLTVLFLTYQIKILHEVLTGMHKHCTAVASFDKLGDSSVVFRYLSVH